MTSDPAPIPPLMAFDRAFLEAAGRYMLDMGLPKPRKFKTIEGDRRMLAERSPGAANLISITGGKS